MKKSRTNLTTYADGRLSNPTLRRLTNLRVSCMIFVKGVCYATVDGYFRKGEGGGVVRPILWYHISTEEIEGGERNESSYLRILRARVRKVRECGRVRHFNGMQ